MEGGRKSSMTEVSGVWLSRWGGVCVGGGGACRSSQEGS